MGCCCSQRHFAKEMACPRPRMEDVEPDDWRREAAAHGDHAYMCVTEIMDHVCAATDEFQRMLGGYLNYLPRRAVRMV